MRLAQRALIAVTLDLPTPPLPLTTAITFLTLLPGFASILKSACGFGGGTGDPEVDEVLMILLNMSTEELRMLPKPLIRQVRSVIAKGLLPEEIAARLGEKLKGI